MQVDDRSFRKALGCFATGVTVISTVDSHNHPVGVTVSAFSSLSLDPPLVLFCLDKRTSSLDAFREGYFAINILREDQRQLSIQFASKKEDKWVGVDYAMSKLGVPVLKDVLAHLECKVQSVLDGGDHLIFIGGVEHIDHQTGGQPLVYFRGAYASLSECH